MPNLRINSISIAVPDGTTLLEAARNLGFEIPTLCFMKDEHPLSTCMVCAVSDKSSGKMYPSCTTLAQDHMDIETRDQEVVILRKNALELMLSEHLGDCEAPCQRVCPANMDIPKMNRWIEKGDYASALEVVRKTIPLPGILGYVCSAPCEKVCRRKDIDQPVSICLLKRYSALTNYDSKGIEIPVLQKYNENKIAIVGSGLAGLSAAYYLLLQGFSCDAFDKNALPGGMLRYGISPEILPTSVLDQEINMVESMGLKFHMDHDITTEVLQNALIPEFDLVLFTIVPEFLNTLEGLEYILTAGIWQLYRYHKKILLVKKTTKIGKMAVQSVYNGRFAAKCIEQYYSGEPMVGIPRRFNSTFGKIHEEEKKFYLKETVNHSGRIIINGNLKGFSETEAKSEASRCLHCECLKPDDCLLRTLSEEYQAYQTTYKLHQRNSISKMENTRGLIYEPQKCIKCGICVQISGKLDPQAGLTFLGRGFHVRIGVPVGFTFENALSNSEGECANNCPTGALAFKDIKKQ